MSAGAAPAGGDATDAIEAHADAFRALRDLGFGEAETRRALSHVGATTSPATAPRPTPASGSASPCGA